MADALTPRVFFSATHVSLHLVPADEPQAPTAKNRLWQLPRDPAKKNEDPNVVLLRSMAAGPGLRESLTHLHHYVANATPIAKTELLNLTEAALDKARDGGS